MVLRFKGNPKDSEGERGGLNDMVGSINTAKQKDPTVLIQWGAPLSPCPFPPTPPMLSLSLTTHKGKEEVEFSIAAFSFS